MKKGGRWASSHRVAYELYRGAIPPGMHVLHRCDMPCCVNPEHLFLGSNADNVRDRVAKNRTCRGEETLQTPLVSDNIREMFVMFRGGASRASIARKFGVGWPTVDKIIKRQRWTHVEVGDE